MNITGTPQAVSALALRQRAEANLQKKANLSPEELRALSPETTQAMLHEMQVHQIELELQNEELRRAQLALKDSQARYFDLYDQAAGGLCQERGLTLAVDPGEGIPDWRLGDAGRLRQVLMNLVGNGLKFIDRGGVKIRVRLIGSEAPQTSLRFEVQDTGIGLSAEDCARLFQPFSQANGTASARRGGTGLGLAISKRIVELMGGRIGVESVLGQGSVFWFEIALAIAPAPEPEVPVASEAGRVQQTAPRRPLRILIAEDREVNRLVFGYMMETLGYQPDFAFNGRAAIEAWENSAYDVILMDCQMPDMDGFEAAREIRRRVRREAIATSTLRDVRREVCRDRRGRLS